MVLFLAQQLMLVSITSCGGDVPGTRAPDSRVEQVTGQSLGTPAPERKLRSGQPSTGLMITEATRFCGRGHFGRDFPSRLGLSYEEAAGEFGGPVGNYATALGARNLVRNPLRLPSGEPRFLFIRMPMSQQSSLVDEANERAWRGRCSVGGARINLVQTISVGDAGDSYAVTLQASDGPHTWQREIKRDHIEFVTDPTARHPSGEEGPLISSAEMLRLALRRDLEKLSNEFVESLALSKDRS